MHWWQIITSASVGGEVGVGPCVFSQHLLPFRLSTRSRLQTEIYSFTSQLVLHSYQPILAPQYLDRSVGLTPKSKTWTLAQAPGQSCQKRSCKGLMGQCESDSSHKCLYAMKSVASWHCGNDAQGRHNRASNREAQRFPISRVAAMALLCARDSSTLEAGVCVG